MVQSIPAEGPAQESDTTNRLSYRHGTQGSRLPFSQQTASPCPITPFIEAASRSSCAFGARVRLAAGGSNFGKVTGG
ncbi:MAG: hypothetical protein DWH82_07525 [Planctomycetota bacterium]|nr:MAG: hypothetical protein DWH82_07525 [Planctomycetota bacterium]